MFAVGFPYETSINIDASAPLDFSIFELYQHLSIVLYLDKAKVSKAAYSTVTA